MKDRLSINYRETRTHYGSLGQNNTSSGNALSSQVLKVN